MDDLFENSEVGQRRKMDLFLRTINSSLDPAIASEFEQDVTALDWDRETVIR